MARRSGLPFPDRIEWSVHAAPSSQLVVYLGPARSGKTSELLRHYIEALRPSSGGGSLNRALWIAPNARAIASVRSQLLRLGLAGCLNPGVTTFHDLARHILIDAKARLRPLNRTAERELLRRVVHRALESEHLQFFHAAARRAAFIEFLAEHFHELQRAGISADAYSKAAPSLGNDTEHRELSRLFTEYEALLSNQLLTDEDNSHRAARDALSANRTPSFDRFKLIVADGFTDFTRVQHGILQQLAQRAEQLLITLPADALEPSPSGRRQGEGALAIGDSTPRTDLFSKVTETLHELKYHHPKLEVRELPARPHPWPALDHALAHIFRNPNHVPPPNAEAVATLPRLQFIAGSSAHDEIVQIARRIKKQLTGSCLPLREACGEPDRTGQGEGSKTHRTPTRPSDILVIFRSLGDTASRVREVLDQFGIPYSLGSNQRLTTAPVVRILLNLLRLDDEDWPFRRLVSVITNNMLGALNDDARRASDWLVRDLQIAGGRDQLLNRVAQLTEIDEQQANASDYLAHRAAAATTALPLLEQLSAAFDALPERTTPNTWFDALTKLAAALGIPRPVSTDACESVDTIAWQSLQNHLASLERLDQWLGTPPRELSPHELLGTLVDIASHESLPPANDGVGRVLVVGAPTARTMSAKHVYLAGMSEQAFPAPERAGRLATDAEYHFLARTSDKAWATAAQNGPPPSTRSQDEMLLFYEVLSRAEESLTISHPALDDKAQQLPPSPYVLELQRVFGEEHRKQLEPRPPQLSPVPADAEVCSPSDWRIQAVARAVAPEPDRRPLAALLTAPTARPLARSIDSALRIIYDRAHGDTFGPSEGMLASPAIAARLAHRFGPKHFWSPSQWETYAACPYKFFLEDVLDLTPLGELVLETDHARRGSRLHNVLASFHRKWPELRGDTAMSADEEKARFLEQLQNVINARVAAASDVGIDAALIELDRRQIHKWALKHFDNQLKYDGACTKRGAQLQPTHFEFRFGPSRAGDDDDPESVKTAFVLDIDGEKIHVTGQIDRIDVGTLNGQTVFSVIDYKSGKKPSLRNEEIASGERLQLPIYVEAAQSLVFKGSATPLIAGYWSMTGGFDAKGALAVEVEGDAQRRWKEARNTVEERIREFVRDIRRGAFPVASRDKDCTSYCDFRTVCRIAQVRSLGKTWVEEIKSSEVKGQESRGKIQKSP